MPDRLAPVTPALADVALPVPLARTFAYRIPREFAGKVRLGCRVAVPFGSRLSIGFVVGFDPADAPDDLKEIDTLVDEEPLVDEAILSLAGWIAERTLCSLGEALRATLPGHAPPKRERIVSLSAPTTTDLFGGAGSGDLEDRIFDALGEVGELNVMAVAKRLGMRATDIEPTLRKLSRAGKVRVRERILAGASGPPRIKIVRVKEAVLEPVAVASAESSVSSTESEPTGERWRTMVTRAPVQSRCMEFLMQAGGVVPLRDLAQAVAGSRGAVSRLTEKGVVSVHLEEWEGTERESHVRIAELELNETQQNAVDEITQALTAREHRVFLLHGVTGSGKTEVYLRALAEARRQGRQSILLVPEITLTPQTVSRLRGRFGGRAAVVHSRMTDAERRRTWDGARRGIYDVVLGPRSAVFAPLPNLGVIVIDEEHEGAYKQEDAPRYQARDVAIERARRVGGVVVLGSATPDLETYTRSERDEFDRLRLPQRVSDLPLPRVRLVDLRGTHGIFSADLLDAIKNRVEKREQVILFLNRRGFSPFVQCGACGEALRCDQCAVSLTFHKVDGSLRCHYCDHEQRAPSACPSCRAENLVFRGTGTQRVEEELRSHLPDLRLARLDSDSVKKAGAHEEILGAFLEGEIDVLLGTQMVAKGLDFPKVTLVGVINADTGLHLPDYRATERTFQVLAQVAGRAGRSARGGEVLIQTRCPDHPCLLAASEHDDEAFRASEVDQRRAMRYPPFALLASVLVRGADLSRVEQTAEAVRDRVAELVARATDWSVVLGPAPAPIAQVRGKHRMRLLIKGETREAVRAAASVARDFSAPSGVDVVVDIDPLDML